MSRRKHVELDFLQKDAQPPSEGQQIVRAVGSRGSNIIEVEYPDGTNTLCLLPAKFHKKIWIKCGNYLIIEDTPDADARVTGQIVSVLYYDHVKQLKRLGTIWPSEFDDVIEEDEPSCDIQGALEKLSIATKCSGSGEEDSESDDDELPPLQQIQNRRVIVYSEDSSEEEVEDTNQ